MIAGSAIGLSAEVRLPTATPSRVGNDIARSSGDSAKSSELVTRRLVKALLTSPKSGTSWPI